MTVDRQLLLADAAATGFRPEMLEKAVRLLGVLDGIRHHPYLRERVVLKGGTALNLFQFRLPRLSVDIDLNYVGARDQETMLEERPKVDQALKAVFDRDRLRVERSPTDYAGGKWQLRYESALGGGGNLQVDVNYLLRVPLWSIVCRPSAQVGSFSVQEFPILDVHELAAGKLAALLSRHAARDLYDSHKLLTEVQLEQKWLRLGFVTDGATNRKDWRTVSSSDVWFEPRELKQNLVPLMTAQSIAAVGDAKAWGKRLVAETQQALATVLPLNELETEFLNRLLEEGEIQAELLSSDPEIQVAIEQSPGLRWKATNVREYKQRNVD